MTDELKIITNNVPRDLVYGIDLTPKERKEFDYYSDEEIVFATFVRYKGWVYDLHEFMGAGNMFKTVSNRNDWHGYHSHSYFSGILVRYTYDCEQVIMGRYYS